MERKITSLDRILIFSFLYKIHLVFLVSKNKIRYLCYFSIWGHEGRESRNESFSNPVWFLAPQQSPLFPVPSGVLLSPQLPAVVLFASPASMDLLEQLQSALELCLSHVIEFCIVLHDSPFNSS